MGFRVDWGRVLDNSGPEGCREWYSDCGHRNGTKGASWSTRLCDFPDSGQNSGLCDQIPGIRRLQMDSGLKWRELEKPLLGTGVGLGPLGHLGWCGGVLVGAPCDFGPDWSDVRFWANIFWDP